MVILASQKTSVMPHYALYNIFKNNWVAANLEKLQYENLCANQTNFSFFSRQFVYDLLHPHHVLRVPQLSDFVSLHLCILCVLGCFHNFVKVIVVAPA